MKGNPSVFPDVYFRTRVDFPMETVFNRFNAAVNTSPNPRRILKLFGLVRVTGGEIFVFESVKDR